MVPRAVAVQDPRLSARVVARRPLRYTAGPDATLDRPAHVRAGSGVCLFDGRLAIVQDDASFVALVDPATLEVDSIPLPVGPGGLRQFDEARGNKADKLDLEACFVADLGGAPCLVALGSGSSPAREHAVIVSRSEAGMAPPRLVALPELYRRLRENRDFSGSELNLEGAVVQGSRLRLFQRGNGEPRGGLVPVNATCEIDCALFAALLEGRSTAPLELEHVLRYDLGAVGGIRLTFTDATSAPGDTVIYLAAAEDSPDAVRDGPVVGAAVGVLGGGSPRYTLLVDASGSPVTDKVEGIVLHPGAPERAYVVVDSDDPSRPSELCDVALEGRWFGVGG